MIRPQCANHHRRAAHPRRGIGLIEVIVCTALVAVMIIPIAGVIRSSGQSIARADGSTSTEAELRRGLRWLGDQIRESDVMVVRARRMQIRLSTGNVALVRVVGGTLLLEDGGTQTILAENVRDVRFTEMRQATPPNTRVGVSMALRARDPVTRAWVTVNSTVAIPPQA
jgi:hypothetical protein